MAGKLLEIAASIVKAQAAVRRISAEEIEQVLGKIFWVLQRLKHAEHHGILFESADESAAPGARLEKVPQPAAPKDSIRENRIMCLECGVERKQLTRRHLAIHGLDQRDYKKKWGLPMRTPLAAKSLSRARSRAAKKRGLPENLVKFLREKKHKAAEAPSLPPSALT
ncbi:MAG TPA: MucR family transcriptional regulator [Syntrophobacteraceae bacterium]|nr:MucR family transcriptional regulator [Syntrophobacteraceae bacterium]